MKVCVMSYLYFFFLFQILHLSLSTYQAWKSFVFDSVRLQINTLKSGARLVMRDISRNIIDNQIYRAISFKVRGTNSFWPKTINFCIIFCNVHVYFLSLEAQDKVKAESLWQVLGANVTNNEIKL
jgi:hypothetical protein